jgi:hypothetical protein
MIPRFLFSAALSLAVLCAATFASAHPGHGVDGGRHLLHYLSASEHLLPLLGLVAAAVAALLVGRRRVGARARRRFQR